MSIRMKGRVGALILCLGLILTSGCTNFLKPEVGAVARKDARILLANDIPAGIWQTGDLRVAYSLSQKGEECTFVGTLVFDRHLSDSFPAITKFFIYLSYLDGDGKVIETIDISPLIHTFGTVPESLPLKSSHIRPPGSKSFTFHYFGGFRSDSLKDGGDWSIYHFPFN
ncbi:MAG: hypothetical protein V2B20_15075 [Pseudomonadota bacterium]